MLAACQSQSIIAVNTLHLQESKAEGFQKWYAGYYCLNCSNVLIYRFTDCYLNRSLEIYHQQMDHHGNGNNHEYLDESMGSTTISNGDRHAVTASEELMELSTRTSIIHSSDLPATNEADYSDKLSLPLPIDLDIATSLLNDSSESRKRSHDLDCSFDSYSDSRPINADAMPRLGLSSSSSSNSANDGQHLGIEC